MAKRALHGEARFKVRRNALLLDRFTIARLVQATGLNPESVRTEVQRMKQEGFVVSDAGSGRRGAQYRLSDDPEKRLAFSHSLEAFYLEHPQPAQRPTSRLFKVAVQSLEQAEKEKGEKREKLLEQAAHWLEGAWQAEGADRAPESVQAYIMREQARLAYLGGHREPAQELFQKAKKAFDALDLQSEVRLIDEYLACIAARRRMEVESATDPAGLARCVLSTLQTMDVALSPLVRLLADLVQSLSRSGDSRVLDALQESMSLLRIQITHSGELDRPGVGERDAQRTTDFERIVTDKLSDASWMERETRKESSSGPAWMPRQGSED